MRVGDILYFSPKYKFLDLKWDDKKNLTDAFKDRVEGFYLEPTRKLNEEKKAFAAGVLCGATIDFLAKIETDSDKVGERFEYWVKNNIEPFNKPDSDNPSRTLAYRFYDEFRNGLVHEGRIKKAGQFSYDYDSLVQVVNVNRDKSVMIINPNNLLMAIDISFRKYIEKVKNEDFAFQVLKCALIRNFQRDVKYANM